MTVNLTMPSLAVFEPVEFSLAPFDPAQAVTLVVGAFCVTWTCVAWTTASVMATATTISIVKVTR